MKKPKLASVLSLTGARADQIPHTPFLSYSRRGCVLQDREGMTQKGRWFV